MNEMDIVGVCIWRLEIRRKRKDLNILLLHLYHEVETVICLQQLKADFRKRVAVCRPRRTMKDYSSDLHGNPDMGSGEGCSLISSDFSFSSLNHTIKMLFLLEVWYAMSLGALVVLIMLCHRPLDNRTAGAALSWLHVHSR